MQCFKLLGSAAMQMYGDLYVAAQKGYLSALHFWAYTLQVVNILLFPKGGEIRDTKTLNLSRNIVSLQVFVHVSRFSPCVINLSRSKNICCGLKKVVAKSRAWDYFEQQILALLLVFHQTHNLSRNKFARALQINQSARRISSTRNKCFCCGSSWSSKVKNEKHRPKLATKQCCATSWGFLYLVFRRLNWNRHPCSHTFMWNTHSNLFWPEIEDFNLRAAWNEDFARF